MDRALVPSEYVHEYDGHTQLEDEWSIWTRGLESNVEFIYVAHMSGEGWSSSQALKACSSC